MKDINLLPEDMKKNKGNKQDGGGSDFRDKLDPMMVLAIIGIVFVLAVVFFAPVLYNKYLESRYQSVRDTIQSGKFDEVYEVDKAITEIEEVIGEKVTLMSFIDRNVVSASEVFVAIKSVLPQGATITSLNHDGSNVTINGTIVESVQIGEILTRAERFRFFEVDDRTSVTLGGNNEFTFNFEVVKGGGD